MRAHSQSALGICPSLPAPARFLVFSGVVFTLQKLKQKPAPSSVSPEDPAEVGWRLEAGSSNRRRNFIRKA